MPTSAHVWEDRVRNDNKGVMSRHFVAESRRERHRTAFELRLCDYKMGTGRGKLGTVSQGPVSCTLQPAWCR